MSLLYLSPNNIIGQLLSFGWFDFLKVAFVLYVIKFYYGYFNRKNPLNGPIPLPLIGNIHLIGKNTADSVTKLSKKYGDTFEIYLLSARIIIISDQKDAEIFFNNSPNNKFFARPS